MMTKEYAYGFMGGAILYAFLIRNKNKYNDVSYETLAPIQVQIHEEKTKPKIKMIHASTQTDTQTDTQMDSVATNINTNIDKNINDAPASNGWLEIFS